MSNDSITHDEKRKQGGDDSFNSTFTALDSTSLFLVPCALTGLSEARVD